MILIYIAAVKNISFDHTYGNIVCGTPNGSPRSEGAGRHCAAGLEGIKGDFIRSRLGHINKGRLFTENTFKTLNRIVLSKRYAEEREKNDRDDK
jgi:hypothetical protein